NYHSFLFAILFFFGCDTSTTTEFIALKNESIQTKDKVTLGKPIFYGFRENMSKEMVESRVKELIIDSVLQYQSYSYEGPLINLYINDLYIQPELQFAYDTIKDSEQVGLKSISFDLYSRHERYLVTEFGKRNLDFDEALEKIFAFYHSKYDLIEHTNRDDFVWENEDLIIIAHVLDNVADGIPRMLYIRYMTKNHIKESSLRENMKNKIDLRSKEEAERKAKETMENI